MDHSNLRIRSDVNEYIRYLMDEAAGRLGAAATALASALHPSVECRSASARCASTSSRAMRLASRRREHDVRLGFSIVTL